MRTFIPQMEPLITDAEGETVREYMQSGGWLTEFEKTRLLEKKICEFTGARYAVMAPSGTLALFLALSACGIGPGDEVIVPDLTMAASATAVVLAGAKPVFADIEEHTFCLNLGQMERFVTAKTKAVMFVTLNGRAPRNFIEFAARFKKRGIMIIEDAAQSLGSFLAGRHLGTIGDCGCFSFSSQKIITTGQGGAVVTDNEELYRRMGLLRDFGRLEGGTDRYSSIGWNLKFTDLQAVVALSQMERIESILAKKKRLFLLYREYLSDVRGVVMPKTDLADVTPWFIDVLVDKHYRKALIKYLRDNNIGSREFYPALHAEPAFADVTSSPDVFSVAEAVSASGLWLPSSLQLDETQVKDICDHIRQFFVDVNIPTDSGESYL